MYNSGPNDCFFCQVNLNISINFKTVIFKLRTKRVIKCVISKLTITAVFFNLFITCCLFIKMSLTIDIHNYVFNESDSTNYKQTKSYFLVSEKNKNLVLHIVYSHIVKIIVHGPEY